MQIRDLGEFGVIELLKEAVTSRRHGPDHGQALGFKLLVDEGDDAAAWQTGKAVELLTTDTMVEGVHFNRETTPWTDLGWKSLASNISDIAAMGGQPLYAVITLGLPPETEVEDINRLYDGLLEISNAYGVAIVGGDMVRSPVVFITVGLTGVQTGEPMTRSSAKVGDSVGVTGYVGSSGAGLKYLLEATNASPAAAEHLKQQHRRPSPAIAAGITLCRSGIRTAMDISDGLGDDLSKLCQASGVAARIYADQVPVHPLVKETYPDTWLELSLGGGEDYQLLFTGPPDLVSVVLSQLPEGSAVIGEITEGKAGRVVLAGLEGGESDLLPSGWDHYR